MNGRCVKPLPSTLSCARLPIPRGEPCSSGSSRSDEITVVELTRGSGVTQGAICQHLKSLKQAGLVAERAQGRNVYYRAEPRGSPRSSIG